MKGFPVTLKLPVPEIRSPLAADGAERGHTSSEPLSRDHIRSAFEYWPIVKQRLIQTPPHNAFPQRPNFLPFGFQYCQADKFINADFNNNTKPDRLVPSSFSPNTPVQKRAFVPNNKDSELLASSPLGVSSSSFDSLLWHNFYKNSNYSGFDYNLCPQRLSKTFHPYKVSSEKTNCGWPFTNTTPAVRPSPTLSEEPSKALSVLKSPLFVSRIFYKNIL